MYEEIVSSGVCIDFKELAKEVLERSASQDFNESFEEVCSNLTKSQKLNVWAEMFNIKMSPRKLTTSLTETQNEN